MISYKDTRAPSRYVEAGYKSRADYLEHMALDYGVDLETVWQLANVYGPSEDFDGLVNALEDAAELAW